MSGVASAGAAAPNADALRRDARAERTALFGVSLPALTLVLLLMVIPVAWLFWLSFLADDGSVSLVNYQRLLAQPSYARIFAATFEISFLTMFACILLGYPLAYLLSQLPRRLADLCMIGVLMPFWTSILVRTYAWLVLLQRHGLVNNLGIRLGLWREPLALTHNFGGTLIGLIHIMLPFLVLPLYGSMRTIDRDYLKAAAGLGAGPVRCFWLVFFPLSLPGLFAGALIVFILCLGSYVTPEMLGGGRVIMVANAIATDIQLFFNWGAASALGVVLLVLTLAILYASSRLIRLHRVFGGNAP
jgi:putative spermidine/putrescine transport system permease protein/spermidine/putrescine transport system permease protein